MSLWQRLKNEIKRLIYLDLHSNWEVFYFDLIAFLLSFLLSPLLYWLVDLFGATEQVGAFVDDNIITPLEKNTVRQIAPSGLANGTYRSIAYGLVYLAELALFHLMICAMFTYSKSQEFLMVTATEVDSGRGCLPQFMRRSTQGEEKDEERVSLCQCTKSELKRLWRLELHSCWEVFYIDAMLVVANVILSVPVITIIYYLQLEKVTYKPFNEYIEKPLESAVIRPVVESIQSALPVPTGLTDRTYFFITQITIYICILIAFHCMICYFYLSDRNRKTVQTVDDVEAGTTCFPRSRVALKGEKKRRLEKVYQSMIPAPSSYLTEDKVQLIKKAFP